MREEKPAPVAPGANEVARANPNAQSQNSTTPAAATGLARSFAPLEAYNQFVLWRYILKADGTRIKTAVSPRDLSAADAHDPANWLSKESAYGLQQIHGDDYGVGFTLTKNDPFFLLDLDNVRDEAGNWSPEAVQWYQALHGCAWEVSVSGRGAHIVGSLPGGVIDSEGRDHRTRPLDASRPLEFYTHSRFLTLSNINAEGDAAYKPPHMARWVGEVFGFRVAKGGDDWTEAPVAEWDGYEDDDDLIAAACKSRSAATAFGGGVTFADLWERNVEALAARWPYSGAKPHRYDASSADAALAQHLAFWTGNDCARIDRLMRRSALVRDKWDYHTGYIHATVTGACGKQTTWHKRGGARAVDPGRSVATTDAVGDALLQSPTQDNVALVFAREFAGRLLFAHAHGRWYLWGGTHWKPEDTGRAFNFARDLARRINRDGKSSMATAAFYKGVEYIAQRDPTFSVAGTEFDTDNYMLNTPAGTLDLRGNVLREHSPADRISKCTAVAPSPDGGESFRSFLHDVTGGDAELIRFIQAAMGACLSGAIEDHWLLFLHGPPRCGKNTLVEAIASAMGDYAKKVPANLLTASKNDRHPTEIANLQGTRLAWGSELGDGEFWHAEKIKELTGDAELSARVMRGDPFEFRRTHKHVVSANNRPQLRSDDPGIRARLKIVPFSTSWVGREDRGLPARLATERPFILHWLIEGHAAWLAAGRRLPACGAVDAAVEDYFQAQSTVDMWIAERVEDVGDDGRGGRAWPASKLLYSDYHTWKAQRGEQPVSQTRWAETMGQRFRKVKAGGAMRYVGAALRTLE